MKFDIETLKKYWYVLPILVLVYFLFMNKKGKTVRRRYTTKARGYARRGYSSMKRRFRRK